MGLVSQIAEGLAPHQEGLSCPDCKQALQATMALSFCHHCRFPLMEIAGKYKLEKLLAQGGYGAIYLARHMRLSHCPERVIKIIKPELLTLPSIRARFRREVQITARLAQKSPHIVHVYDDFGECPRLGDFYVMEYLKGISLRERINTTNGPLPIATIAHIFGQLTEAIQVAHNAQILHRDLKPENLLLIEKHGDNDFLKVVDFGIAKPLGDEHVSLGITQGPMGTPAYMAPEQCLHRNLDERTDIYALGTILYELLTGVTPFPWAPNEASAQYKVQDIWHAQIHQHPPPLYLRASNHAFVQPLEDVVQRALAKAPHKRYSSVAAMWEDLQPALAAQKELPTVQHLTRAPSSPAPWIAPTDEPALAPIHRQPIKNAPASTVEPRVATAPGQTLRRQPIKNAPASTVEPPLIVRSAPMAPAIQSRWPFIAALFLVAVAAGWWAIKGIMERHIPASSPTKAGAAPQTKRRQPPFSRPHASDRREPTAAVGPEAAPLKTRHASPREPRQTPPEDKHRRQPPAGRESVGRRQHRRALVRKKKAPHVHERKRNRQRVLSIRAQPRRRQRPRQGPSPKRPSAGAGRWAKGCPKTSLYWVFARFPDATQRDAVRPVLPPGGSSIKRSDGICFGVKEPHMRVVFGHSAQGFVPCHLYPARSAARVRIQLIKEGEGLEPGSRQYCIRGH